MPAYDVVINGRTLEEGVSFEQATKLSAWMAGLGHHAEVRRSKWKLRR